MKTNNSLVKCAALLLLSTLNLQLSTFAQGSLTPPGAPAPLFKTLDQVEARTPVDATHTPGDADSLFVIANAGSYYLTTNIVGVASKNGIKISSSNVTLDLNGFSLLGSSSGLCGITNSGFSHSLVIRNGAVSGWRDIGIMLAGSTNCSVEGIRLTLNGSIEFSGRAGVIVGNNSLVTRCTAWRNYNTGISVGVNSVVKDCAADSNQGNNSGHGIGAGSGSTVSGCSVSSNSTGISCDFYCRISDCTATRNSYTGISANDFSRISDCAAYANSDGFFISNESVVTACIAAQNARGFVVGSGANISGCSANRNSVEGILAGSDCLILNNTASYNGTGTTGAGIKSIVGNNRIDGNHCFQNNGTGIRGFSSDSDYIIRNISGQNTTNYYPASGTYTGPVGTPGTATSPWANF